MSPQNVSRKRFQQFETSGSNSKKEKLNLSRTDDEGESVNCDIFLTKSRLLTNCMSVLELVLISTNLV